MGGASQSISPDPDPSVTERWLLKHGYGKRKSLVVPISLGAKVIDHGYLSFYAEPLVFRSWQRNKVPLEKDRVSLVIENGVTHNWMWLSYSNVAGFPHKIEGRSQ